MGKKVLGKDLRIITTYGFCKPSFLFLLVLGVGVLIVIKGKANKLWPVVKRL